MPGFNQQGPSGDGKLSGRKRGMCRRTEDSLFPDVKNGRGRGQAWEDKAKDMKDSAGQSVAKNKISDKLENLKEQYRVTKNLLKAISKKIKALRAGKSNE